jgi:hypothetical protein
LTKEQVKQRHRALTQSGYPTISIPQDAIIEGQDSSTGFSYHYVREDRLQAKYECAASPKAKGFRGWIRTNRGLAITLLDVLILIILILLIRTVVMPTFSVFQGAQHPYRMELKATGVEQLVLAHLSILPRQADYTPPISGGWFGFYVFQGEVQPTRRDILQVLETPGTSATNPHDELQEFLFSGLVGYETFFDLLPEHPFSVEFPVSIIINTHLSSEPIRVWSISVIPELEPVVLSVQLGLD